MYEFWYDNVNPKFVENAKLYYIDTDGLIVHVKHCSCKKIVHVKTDDICNDITENIETKFATSTLDRPLPKEKN